MKLPVLRSTIGLKSGHRRASGETAKAKLGDRRRDHALGVFIFEILIDVAVRAQTQKSPVDQMDALDPPP